MAICLLAGGVVMLCSIFFVISVTVFSLFIIGKQKLLPSCSKPWTSRGISIKKILINHLFTKMRAGGIGSLVNEELRKGWG